MKLQQRNGGLLTLCEAAALTALYVVLSMLSLNLGNMRVTFDGLPVVVGAALFGPWYGMAIGLLGSFINQLLTYGITATTALWIIPAGARGLLVGWYARKCGYAMTDSATVIIVILSSLMVTALNTVVMWLDSVIYGYFTWAYVFGALIARVAAGVITAVCYAAVLTGLLRVVKKVSARAS